MMGTKRRREEQENTGKKRRVMGGRGDGEEGEGR